MKKSSLIKTGTRIALAFFKGEKKFLAISGLITLILFELFGVYISVRFNQWNAQFYDALQNLNKAEFIKQIAIFAILAGIFIANALIKIGIRLWYSMKWRQWMTGKYIDAWTKNNTYYTSKVFNLEVDNPDQRISQDISEFSDLTISLVLGFLSAITSLVSFTVILWGISGIYELHISNYKFNIHGFFVWIALIYSLLGTYLTHKIGSPLSNLLFKQEQKEADFRFQMIRLRENAEAIAMYDATDFEQKGMLLKFKEVLNNTKHIIVRQMKITTFVSFYQQISVILPILIAAPKYFLSQITLGILMQTSNAFSEVKTALSWIIDSYATIANLRAVIERLDNFDKSIKQSNKLKSNTQLKLSYNENNLSLQNLKVYLPDNKLLFSCDNLYFNKGSYLIMGKSGSGKSTLFRALKGVWPFVKGEISFSQNSKLMFIPQKKYMPLGSLKMSITYPCVKNIEEDIIHQLLLKFDLEHLTSKLNTTDEWSRVLSVGEQQKLAFLRCIINKPDIIFLDEATSALDIESEKNAYEALNQNLKNSTIISIAHKDSLKSFHDKILLLQNNELIMNY